jgi:WD40 repeat protein
MTALRPTSLSFHSRIWDCNLESRQSCLQTLLCSSGRVTDILPDYSGMLCVGHYDGALRVYSSNSSSGKPLYEVRLHTQPISSVRTNVNDSLLVTLSRDSRIRVVDKRTVRTDHFVCFALLSVLIERDQQPWLADFTSLARNFPPSSSSSSSSSFFTDSVLLLLVLVSSQWKPLLSIRDDHFTSPTETNAAVFSADGKQVLAGGSSGEVFVWNATTGKLKERLAGPSSAVATTPHFSAISSSSSSKPTNQRSICGMALNGGVMVTVHKDRSLSFWGE